MGDHSGGLYIFNSPCLLFGISLLLLIDVHTCLIGHGIGVFSGDILNILGILVIYAVNQYNLLQLPPQPAHVFDKTPSAAYVMIPKQQARRKPEQLFVVLFVSCFVAF